ncbi:MAG: hypothetical protein L3K10_07470 [Thermoplasmata archaeon]|nr:hypothetical protein [Thermoplasmata archaeon]
MAPVPQFDPAGLLTLREIRSFIRRSSARGGVVFFGLLYVLGSLFIGGMVVFGNIQGGYQVTALWGSANGGSWNYPGLLIVAPWGVVSLPFFATFAMIVVGVGVGLGMTVAFLLGLQLLRPRTEGRGRTGASGALAGLTPAMISLVTLGACCSTTAAATAGVGLVAQASGTSVSNLLVNNWYLGVFQIVVVWVALVAQEMLLVVYAGLFGRTPIPGLAAGPPLQQPIDRRFVAAGFVRVGLLAGGLAWGLSVLAEWTTVNPATAGPGFWFQWMVQHELLAGLAIAGALFPRGTLSALSSPARGGGRWFRSIVRRGALSLIWVPPPFPAWGLDGFLNQVLGALGGPASLGAISPGPISGAALLTRWALEYLLVTGFCLAVVSSPRVVLGWLAGVPTGHPRETADAPSLAHLGDARAGERRSTAAARAEAPESIGM